MKKIAKLSLFLSIFLFTLVGVFIFLTVLTSKEYKKANKSQKNKARSKLVAMAVLTSMIGLFGIPMAIIFGYYGLDKK